MRLQKYKIWDISAEHWIKRVQTVPRWQKVFLIDDGKIVLKTYKDVENLIELLSDTYLRSEMTDREYKTDVKDVVSELPMW